MQTNKDYLEEELIALINGYGWEEVLRTLSRQMHGQDKELIELRCDIKDCLYKLEKKALGK